MMNDKLESLSVDDLVRQFEIVALEQEKMILPSDQTALNKLVWRMHHISQELKQRNGDARRALLLYYAHPNLHVRLKAATATLALAPVDGRRVLEMVASSGLYPQAGEAGMSLWALDEGIFKPT